RRPLRRTPGLLSAQGGAGSAANGRTSAYKPPSYWLCGQRGRGQEPAGCPSVVGGAVEVDGQSAGTGPRGAS
ncbi:hypothetical protein U0070_012923, partial [Myodes glareolus]